MPTFRAALDKALERQGAVDYLRQLQRDAQESKRAHGNPRNPRAARPGHEKEFQDAAQTAHHLRVVLNEIEKNPARERRALTARKAVLIADKGIDLVIGIGLAAFAALGIAALFILLHFPEPVIQIAALAGLGLSVVNTAAGWRRK